MLPGVGWRLSGRRRIGPWLISCVWQEGKRPVPDCTYAWNPRSMNMYEQYIHATAASSGDWIKNPNPFARKHARAVEA